MNSHTDFTTLTTSLSQNISTLYSTFKHTPDLIVRYFQIKNNNQSAALVYLESLCNVELLSNQVLKPLLSYTWSIKEIDSIIPLPFLTGLNKWDEIIQAILHGKSILLINDQDTCIIFDVVDIKQRSIEEPSAEKAIKGAHQGFIESASDNISLIRQYIPTSKLCINEISVGNFIQNQVSILYLEDIASFEVLKRLEKRIRNIHVRDRFSTGELQELIEDYAFSPFPQCILTERPDTAALHILEGRFVVIVKNSPHVLIAPVTFICFFQHIDDYNLRILNSNLIRIIRFISFYMAILLPAIYISLVSFNYELIPIELLLTIGKYRANVPFPPLIEALIMEIAFELLREASIRLPSAVSQTIGIVGAIVIGQAAVQAGIVSNMMIIIVASTAIASFIVPNNDMSSAIRLIRFPMMLMASLFGIVGIVIGMMTLIAHILSLKSLGLPLAPLQFSNFRDSLLRFPLWKIKSKNKSNNK
ncbi:spore germination protein [Bacillus bombysepticus]|uniref:Spore germination protein n=1 Tax=Bacillus thuringiensis serovar kumamotoensis TaxID=132267 RepID=A0A9X6PSR0_BACUK|nr:MULTISPECIES: spore germination protein [Bacillus cereus group]MBY0015095.1 spore germination protein [Bacillus cereus]MEC2873298.1 spore germination protein [Bacillus cereus]OTZ77561.1 spore germination protein [Bacillus thuringiensis serovar kumamtoensis]